MSRLEQLLEQTTFLLDLQKKAQVETTATFTELLSFMESKIKELSDESKTTLEGVHDTLSGHAQQFTNDVKEDIEFLEEQVEAINEIKKIEDPEKMQDMLKSIIEDEEELPDTDGFKKSVIAEYTVSKKSLVDIIDEIKELISSGDFDRVKLLIEAFAGEDEEFDIECDEECEECPSSCGENIFEHVHEQDKKSEEK